MLYQPFDIRGRNCHRPRTRWECVALLARILPEGEAFPALGSGGAVFLLMRVRSFTSCIKGMPRPYRSNRQSGRTVRGAQSEFCVQP